MKCVVPKTTNHERLITGKVYLFALFVVLVVVVLLHFVVFLCLFIVCFLVCVVVIVVLFLSFFVSYNDEQSKNCMLRKCTSRENERQLPYSLPFCIIFQNDLVVKKVVSSLS